MDIDDFLDKTEKKDGTPKKETEGEESLGPLELIEKIRILMAEKKFEEAERKYVTAKERFAELTRKQFEEQAKIFNALEELNREMVSALQGQKDEAGKKMEVISELVARVRNHLSRDELKEAVDLYNQIDALFRSLPDIVHEKKLGLEQEIAKLHVDIVSRTNVNQSKEFHQKFHNIRNLLSMAFEHANRGSRADAVAIYNRINQEYESLPKGFLYEKALLYEQILKLFRAVQHMQPHRETQREGPAKAAPEKKKDEGPPGIFSRIAHKK